MQKEILEKIYSQHHERGKRYGYLFCQGERVPHLKRWVGNGKKVLDLGCRDGVLTQGIVEGNEVIGADIDRKALLLCKKRLGIETVWVDLNQEWPWEEESFDVIIACEILEHLFFMDPILEKIQKTLKKGGVFIGSVPHAFRMRNRMKFLFGKEYDSDPTHVRQFSKAKLKTVLNSYFSDIEILPLGGKIFPFVPVVKQGWLSFLFAKDLLWRAIRE